MKIGFRIPSITKRIAARTSVQRVIRHNLGFKAPKGMGWVTDPKKALYNRVYTRTTRGCLVVFLGLFGFFVCCLWLLGVLGHILKGKLMIKSKAIGSTIQVVYFANNRLKREFGIIN